jgi:NAD(P)-dependent dehydrogenase (short-subunit alcohol dehydrogenase family)
MTNKPVPSTIPEANIMTNSSSPGLSRRLFVQSAVLTAVMPRAWAKDDPCRGLQPRPEGSGLAFSAFGEGSTAQEVTDGLDLRGQTAVVTGCNSGLGFETMRVLASRGAHIVGTARTREKAEKACSNIEGKTTPVVLELSDFSSARSAAQAINEMNIPIDMLICNAGIMALPELELVNGLERQFVINHLGHFVFVNALVDAVKQAERGRIVMLSSCAHQQAPAVGIDFDNLDGSQSYDSWKAYGRSKLSNGLFAAELSRRLKQTGVTANSVHPGVIKTNLARYIPGSENRTADDPIYNKTIPQGAATQCYVAANTIPANITGQYFADCNPAKANPLMYDEELARRLWSVSEQLTA